MATSTDPFPTMGTSLEGMRNAFSLLPLAVYACDQDGRLTFFNEKAVELWGRTPDLGDPSELWCGSYRLWQTDGSPLPHDATPMARAVREGVSARDTKVVIEHPDGSRVIANVNVDPLLDAAGNIVGAINAFQDITDRVVAEVALRHSEERYQVLVEALALAVYTTDAEGRITLFNDAAVAMWGREPEVGVDLWCGSWRIYHPDGEPIPLDRCPMAIALTEDRIVRDVEIMVERPDGARRAVLPYPTPLHDASGKLIGAVNVLVDITERKQAEQERIELLDREREAREVAEAAVRARDEFLSIASHELRNPVAGIHGTAQILKRFVDRGHVDLDQLAEYGSGLLQTSSRLVRLVDDLLDVGRLQTGQLQLRTETVDLRELVDEVVGSFSTNSHSIVLTQVEAGLLGDIDRTRIRQVLENLLENATKYSPEGGEVAIAVRRNGAMGEVTVADHGIGIPVTALGSIFEPFGRASNAAEAHIPGMGLGLFVSRQLAEAHGGRLDAFSEGVGRGASFKLSLPLTA